MFVTKTDLESTHIFCHQSVPHRPCERLCYQDEADLENERLTIDKVNRRPVPHESVI